MRDPTLISPFRGVGGQRAVGCSRGGGEELAQSARHRVQYGTRRCCVVPLCTRIISVPYALSRRHAVIRAGPAQLVHTDDASLAIYTHPNYCLS